MTHLRFTIYDLRAVPSTVRPSSIVHRQCAGWLLVLMLALFSAGAQQRFPPPEFESGHKLPTATEPAARGFLRQYVDVAVLAGSLGLATWLAYRKRSRKAMIALSLFSVVYFGFWRKGCICAIGSLQNVALALGDPNYALPASVLGFFVLPLAVALFAGRSFCAAVCPHGALQDLVLLKPIKVPDWLEQGLSVLPFIYLGAGVLFAATGSAFIICQYDPFVPVFRMSGRALMVLSGVALLLLGVFVGRPYCRFLCPYGALLKLAATFSRWRVRVTPTHCTQCRLCESSCPFGALYQPQAVETEPRILRTDRRRLGLLLLLLPFLVTAGVFSAPVVSSAMARVHPTVALAERYLQEKDSPAKIGVLSPDDLALERARQHPDELLNQARVIQRKFKVGSWIFGGWIGLVIGLKLIALSLHRQRTDFEPASGACFACARCFAFCPNELMRRGVTISAIAATQAQGTKEVLAQLEVAK
ncbi:MAG TPA: 4Fe-4S binding protein [Verrucomicrobiae bacterium]|nr:4Fe-4S binding protein [Verrucomicrobiae bacterium]